MKKAIPIILLGAILFIITREPKKRDPNDHN